MPNLSEQDKAKADTKKKKNSIKFLQKIISSTLSSLIDLYRD
jgi:hypothetical protein